MMTIANQETDVDYEIVPVISESYESAPLRLKNYEFKRWCQYNGMTLMFSGATFEPDWSAIAINELKQKERGANTITIFMDQYQNYIIRQ